MYEIMQVCIMDANGPDMFPRSGELGTERSGVSEKLGREL